jgi:hypothetical protein
MNITKYVIDAKEEDRLFVNDKTDDVVKKLIKLAKKHADLHNEILAYSVARDNELNDRLTMKQVEIFSSSAVKGASPYFIWGDLSAPEFSVVLKFTKKEFHVLVYGFDKNAMPVVVAKLNIVDEDTVISEMKVDVNDIPSPETLKTIKAAMDLGTKGMEGVTTTSAKPEDVVGSSKDLEKLFSPSSSSEPTTTSLPAPASIPTPTPAPTTPISTTPLTFTPVTADNDLTKLLQGTLDSNKKLLKDMNALSEKCKALETKAFEENKRIKQLENDVNQKKKEHDAIQTELNHKLQELDAEKQKLAHINENMKIEIESLKTQVAASQEETLKHTSKITPTSLSTLEEEYKKKEDAHKQKAELDASKILRLEQTNKKSLNELEELKKKHTDLTEQAVLLKNQLDHETNEFRELKEENNILTNRAELLENHLNQNTTELQTILRALKMASNVLADIVLQPGFMWTEGLYDKTALYSWIGNIRPKESDPLSAPYANLAQLALNKSTDSNTEENKQLERLSGTYSISMTEARNASNLIGAGSLKADNLFGDNFVAKFYGVGTHKKKNKEMIEILNSLVSMMQRTEPIKGTTWKMSRAFMEITLKNSATSRINSSDLKLTGSDFDKNEGLREVQNKIADIADKLSNYDLEQADDLKYNFEYYHTTFLSGDLPTTKKLDESPFMRQLTDRLIFNAKILKCSALYPSNETNYTRQISYQALRMVFYDLFVWHLSIYAMARMLTSDWNKK